MLRDLVIGFACEELGCVSEEPWPRYPGHVVLRHPSSGKWVGVVMAVPRSRIGLSGEEEVRILNVKLEPALVSGLRGQEGFAPAYHMNKAHWLSVRLDGSVPSDQVKALLEMSFALVSPRGRKTALMP